MFCFEEKMNLHSYVTFAELRYQYLGWFQNKKEPEQREVQF